MKLHTLLLLKSSLRLRKFILPLLHVSYNVDVKSALIYTFMALTWTTLPFVGRGIAYLV